MPPQPNPEADLARAGRRDEISLSGLTRAESREFNKLFLISFIVFTLVAVVAHYLVWVWRPWLQTTVPGVQTGLLDAIHPYLTFVG